MNVIIADVPTAVDKRAYLNLACLRASQHFFRESSDENRSGDATANKKDGPGPVRATPRQALMGTTRDARAAHEAGEPFLGRL